MRFHMVQQCKAATHHITKYLTAQEATFALPLFFQCLEGKKTRQRGNTSDWPIAAAPLLATPRASNLFGIRRSASRTSNFEIQEFHATNLANVQLQYATMHLRSSQNSVPLEMNRGKLQQAPSSRMLMPHCFA